MSGASPAGAIWRRLLPVWLVLMALLGLNAGCAYAPLGGWSAAVQFGLAATQAGLVAAAFMRLSGAGALVRVTAACGLFWGTILFTLTMADVLSRLSNS